MKILAVDTSSTSCSVSVVDDLKIVCEMTVCGEKNHAETISEIVEIVLKASKMTVLDIDLFAVSSGPGSFTGLRIGAATIKGLSFATKKPVVAVPTLDALAYNTHCDESLIVPIMDARRGEVYAGIYEKNGTQLTNLTGVLAENIDVLLDRIREFGKNAVFVGDGVAVFLSEIFSAGFSISDPRLCLSRAASVGFLARALFDNGMYTDCDGLSIEYARLPQAERELNEKNAAKHAEKINA